MVLHVADTRTLSADRKARSAAWLRLSRLPSLPRVLEWLIGVVAALSVLGFVVAGALRVVYPYAFDRTEEASVAVLREMLAGRPIYGPPTLSYVPVVYPPLYFVLAAPVALLTGPTLAPLRLVSLFASLAGIALLYVLVARETRARLFGLVAAGLFAGSTRLSLTSLDLARVDALGVALMLGAICAMRAADWHPRFAGRLSALAGLLAGLSIVVKQTDAFLAAALFAYAAFAPRGRLLPYTLALAASVLVPLALVWAQVGDWARFYLFDLPRRHVLEDSHIGGFWTDTLLPRFTLPLVLGPLFFVAPVQRFVSRPAMFYALVCVSLICAAWLGWAGRGGAENVLEPAYAALSMLFALGIWHGRRLLGHDSPGVDDGRLGGGGQRLVRTYLLGVCLVQFVILGYNPRATVPFRSETWAGDRLVATIAQLPGRVLAPDFAEYAFAAGKGEQPAMGAALEVVGAFADMASPVGDQWRADLARALRARTYDYVLWDPRSDAFVIRNVLEANGYTNVGPLFSADDDFNRWKSGRTPDVQVYVPAERAASFTPR